MNWYIGQDIVCIKTHPEGIIKDGDTFTINAIKQLECKCGIGIDVGIKSNIQAKETNHCPTCDARYPNLINDGIWWFKSERFAPLDTLVNISELTEVLNQPAFQ